jgi:catechol 2,3-dioxygenase-like lactoylglutathione lyase family enzyme
MTVQLNHTIVGVRDKRESADFVTEILGLPAPVPFGPFLVVELDNGASLDFADWGDDTMVQHYAFLVSEEEFDEIFGRIRDRGLMYWADPHHDTPGQINRHDGGRGVYFDEPGGHRLEIITRTYGGG